MRGSDADAALHYLARMIEAGEDPRFIARRHRDLRLRGRRHGRPDLPADRGRRGPGGASSSACPRARSTWPRRSSTARWPPSPTPSSRPSARPRRRARAASSASPGHLRDAHYPGAASSATARATIPARLRARPGPPGLRRPSRSGAGATTSPPARGGEAGLGRALAKIRAFLAAVDAATDRSPADDRADRAVADRRVTRRASPTAGAEASAIGSCRSEPSNEERACLPRRGRRADRRHGLGDPGLLLAMVLVKLARLLTETTKMVAELTTAWCRCSARTSLGRQRDQPPAGRRRGHRRERQAGERARRQGQRRHRRPCHRTADQGGGPGYGVRQAPCARGRAPQAEREGRGAARGGGR